MNNNSFSLCSLDELCEVNGGTFWGVCYGVCVCGASIGEFVVGAGTAPTGLGLILCGNAAINYGIGIHTIVSNI